MELSMVKKILAEKGARVQLVITKHDNGDEYYYYLVMKEMDFYKMEDAAKSQPINPADWGEVLVFGEGNEPTKEHEEMVNAMFKDCLV